MTVNTVDIIYQIVAFGLLILFVVIFILFIKRLLINSSGSNHRLKNIEDKLDRLIDIMEEKKD